MLATETTAPRVTLDLSGDEHEDTPLSATASSGSSSDSTSSVTAGRRTPLRALPLPLRLPLKRSLRGEVLERWPGWYSPARKRLKSSPEASPRPARPDGEEPLFTWSVLSAQRRNRFRQRVERGTSGYGQDLAQGKKQTNPSEVCEEGEGRVRLHAQEVPLDACASPSRAAQLMSRSAETLGSCRLEFRSSDPCASVDTISPAQCRSAAVNIPEPDREASVIEQLVAGPPEASRVDLEDDLQLLVLSPTEERRRPRSVGMPARCIGLPPRDRRPQCRRPSIWISMLSAMRVPSKKSVISWLWKLRPPYFIMLMGLVQVSVYTIPRATQHAEYLAYYLVWRNSRMARQPWRLLSYALLHSDWMHLTLNVGVQTVVALTLEKEQGPLRVAGVYVGGVMAGALSTAITSPYINLVGASAGVYAILMSHLSHILLNSDVMRYRKTRVAAILVCVGADFAHTAHHAILEGNAAPQIGVSAHCSGALSGMLLGLTIYRSTAPGKFASPRVLWATRISSACLYALPALGTMVWIVSKSFTKSPAIVPNRD